MLGITEIYALWPIYQETGSRQDFIKVVYMRFPAIAADSDDLSLVWRALHVAHAETLRAKTS